MEYRSLVPNQDIADPPFVRVDGTRARRKRDQLVDERLTLDFRQSFDGEGVGGNII